METQEIWTLCVRRWFDKTYGNSYYTMRIVPPRPYSLWRNEDDFVVTFTYGHGYATYIERAERFAVSWEYDLTNAKFIVDEVEVMRRKDLHNNGK